MNIFRKYVLLPLIIACMLVSPEYSQGFGLGLATSVGYGKYGTSVRVRDLPDDSSGPDGINNYDTVWSDQTRESFGVVFDSNVGQNKLFNYRGTLSYLMRQTERTGVQLNNSGITFENDFGLGLVKNESWRFWVGPELRFEKFADWRFGVGPVVGANVDIGNNTALMIKVGYIIGTLSGSFIFGDYESEKFGILSLGLIHSFGGDRKPF